MEAELENDENEGSNDDHETPNHPPKKKKGKSWIPEGLIPYNLLTQQSIPDKTIADAVESLIGEY